MNEPWQPDPAEREPWQQPEAPPADLRHQEDTAAVVAGLHDLGMFKAGEQPRSLYAYGCPASKPPYCSRRVAH